MDITEGCGRRQLADNDEINHSKSFVATVYSVSHEMICGELQVLDGLEFSAQDFCGLFDLCQKMDIACSEGDGPARDKAYRTLRGDKSAERQSTRLCSTEGLEPAQTNRINRDKKGATVFAIEILYRCNASLQGRLSQVHGKTVCFRSAFELMNLIQEAVIVQPRAHSRKRQLTKKTTGYACSTRSRSE